MNNKFNIKIFIADDDPFYRMLYNQHLLNLGYKNNLLFDNGTDCINRLYLHPDIVFLDYHMPPSNGIDILRHIKAEYPDIALLLISGQSDIQVALDALKQGASAYIIKGEEDLQMISGAIDKIVKGKFLNEATAN